MNLALQDVHIADSIEEMPLKLETPIIGMINKINK